MAFLPIEEIKKIGLKQFGVNVLISDKVSFYNPELISIGSNVRIDDFCLLSGNITLHNYIHISAYSALYGKYGIEMENFTGLSPKCTIFSASDDFSGNYLISPMPPEKFTNATGGGVIIKQYSQIGAGSIIMPDLIIEEGCVIGSMSFVKNSTEKWNIYGGIPVRLIKKREKKVLELGKLII